MALVTAVAQCGIQSALFAIAEALESMYEHIMKANGGYTALSSLPDVIQANEARTNQP